MTTPLFPRITIIGLGLIGSSIARAVHARMPSTKIIGCDISDISLAYALKQGFVHEATHDPLASVQNSDVVILASPPATLADIAKTVAPNLKTGAIIMDVASVKEPAIAAIAPHMAEGVYFIPAHPIAGSEHAGVAAGRADLFQHKRVIITPNEPLVDPLKTTIMEFWQALGARVEGMPAHLHDMVYAHVSHLPQLLAFEAKPLLAAYPGEAQTNPIFAQFTRLGGSPVALWKEIFELNSTNILKALDRYLDALNHIHKELKTAPDDAPKENDVLLAHTRLFPRIAASCLVTTVMEAEKKAGFPFARFAGSGFADFTAPAMEAPDEDMERISAQHHIVSDILTRYIDGLEEFRALLMPAV